MAFKGKQLVSILSAVAIFGVSAILAVALSMWYTMPNEPKAPEAASLPSTPGTPPDDLLGAAASADADGDAIPVEFTDSEE